MQKKLRFFLFSLFSFLAGCSTDPKITGTRELFIPVSSNITVDTKLATKEVKLPIVKNKEWLQNEFSSSHEICNAQFDVSTAKLLWDYKLGSGCKSGSSHKLITNIVAKGGVLYAANAFGDIFSFDLQNKKLLWQVNVAKGIESVVKIGGLAILKSSELIVTTARGDLHKIDIKTGEIKKTKNVNGLIRSAPCVFDDRVFVQTANNCLVALDNHLKTLWKQAEMPEDVIFLGNSSPATDGNIVIGAYSTGEYKAYDFHSGNEIWGDFMVPYLQNETVATMLHIYAAPVVSDGLAIIFGHGGRLSANNVTSSTRSWSLDISGLATPAVSGNWAFAIDNQSCVFCIEKNTGNIKWKNTIPLDKRGKQALNWTKPIIGGNALIVVTENGLIVFFDVNTGDVIKTIQSSATSPSSAIIVDSVLYVLSLNGNVYAFG
jgi:outer membrane protein assembly factor BamB